MHFMGVCALDEFGLNEMFAKTYFSMFYLLIYIYIYTGEVVVY